MTRKQRVYLVAHEVHDNGGMERVTAELVRNTHDEFDYVIISRELASDIAGMVEWRKVATPAAPFPLKYLTFALVAGWRLRIARAHEDGIVHTLGAVVPNRVDLATVHMAHVALVRVIGRLDTTTGSLVRRANGAASRLMAMAAERWCYRASRTRVLAGVSKGVAEECRTTYGHPDVVVTPNGVDVGRFTPNPVARAELRRHVPDDVIVAVFVGGEWGRKGLDLVLRGMTGVPRLRLWVVGDGAGEVKAMAGLAASLGIGDRVEFYGPRSDTERFYAGADIFVLPSSYETFSLAAHEAAAVGLPLVTTRVHGVDELVQAGGGLFVERDAEDIRAALELLVKDPERRLTLGRAARHAASSRTWLNSAASTAREYRRLSPTIGRPPPDDRFPYGE